MSEIKQIEVISNEIKLQLANKEIANALLSTTFKGLSVNNMAMALREGMIVGFTFENFMKKDVYAIPFKEGYSLVSSIGYVRKVAMRSGLVGKSEPTYTFNLDKTLESCSITVKRKVGDYVGEYTAKVYFREYTTGRNLWVSKPLTMLAKVAEMHALRSAFPEETSNAFIEEELEKTHSVVVDVPIGITDEDRAVVIKKLEDAKDLNSLNEVWVSLNAKQRSDAGVKATADRLKLSFEEKEVKKAEKKAKKEVDVNAGEVDPAEIPDLPAIEV